MKPDFAEIKRTTDLVRVIESYGVALRKVGNDHVGLCPFHDDGKPSLHVTPGKGLWRCPACGAAGNVIQFVAKKEGITDREAALKLCSAIPGVQRARALAPAAPAADPLAHAELFAAIVKHYHECLLTRGKRGLEYLQRRGLGDVEMLTHFKVGCVDGGLKKKLSAAQIKAAQACGLFNEKGNEKFYGRIVVPILDDQERPVGLYGRDISGQSDAAHIYLAGEHRAVWNGAAAAAHPDELLVTESIFDALAIFAAGRRNVIACYGAGGWTPHHDALIERANVRKLVLAFDQDEAGERASRELAQALDARGVRVHRVCWPEGVKDANDYFLYHEATGFRGTAETFPALLAAAPRLGFTRASTSAGADAPGACALALVERSDEHALFANGSVSYRVKGLGSGNALKVVITAQTTSEKHVDHLDLYGAKARKMFAAAAAARLGIEAQKIDGDLLALVEALEKLRAENGAPTTTAQPPMSEAERAEALALLRAPDLLARVAADIELCGYVGEARNKQLAYLIATSRRLPKPLSCIFRAQSGCGKSFLMECVAELMPPEDVHYFSRLTPQALYYLEPDALIHRLLIVDERDGSEEAEYPIRTLQTRRVLTLAVPLKDPNSGKIKTTVLQIHGPIAYMESTTDGHINPENANRCFELYLDESEAQTRAIFAAQRRARSLDGWRHERARASVAAAHHHAQRLLRSLKVIIPFVELIDFPPSWMRGRRDHDRFLSLIEGIAFLHQHQREIGRDGAEEYIAASVADYAHAYELAHEVLAHAPDELARPVAEFRAQIEEHVAALARAARVPANDFPFTRRQMREATRLPDHLVKRHMRQLEELEYVAVQRAASGGSFRYRLTPGNQAAKPLDGLLAPEALAERFNKKRNKRDTSGTR